MAFEPRPVFRLGEAPRDWPRSLRLSVARDTLAHALYEARGQAFASAQPAWRDLTYADRQRYRDLALTILEGLS